MKIERATYIYTLSEPTVAVSGTSIKSSGTLKDFMLNFTVIGKENRNKSQFAPQYKKSK